MARPKKPTYEWVERLGTYRKRIKDIDGKYFALYAPTPDELTQKIISVQNEIENMKIARDNPTVGQYTERWISLNCNHLKEKTKADYLYIINSFILPEIGTLSIKHVVADDLKSILVPLSNMSSSVYNKTVMLLKKIFDSAVSSEIITRSPASDLKRGGIKPKEKHALTDAQSQILLNALTDTVAYTFVMLGLYAGLRREEILGLQWDCVFLDNEAPHIIVKRSVSWKNNKPIVSEELKSKAAYRSIPIPIQLVECLMIEKESSKSDFVISNRSGYARTEGQYRNLWNCVTCRSVGEHTYYKNRKKYTVTKKLGDKCNNHPIYITIDFHVSPHILRHTYISNLILKGVNIKTVQYLAGHETPEMTLKIYTHLMENQPHNLINEIKTAFEVKNEVKCNTEVAQTVAPQ